jgi:transglutaminase-like putative cysteine protease
MNYRVAQETLYAYAAPVPFSRHLARMLPVNRPGQLVRSAALVIEPVPSERRESLDFFGNRLVHFALDRPHDRLRVRLDAEIAVTRPPLPAPEATPAFEAVGAAAVASRDPGPEAPAHGLHASPSVDLVAAVTAYAATSFPSKTPVLEGAVDLMARIHAGFRYEPGVTDVTTRPAEVFAARAGVCQDFAHLMIAGLRGLSLPARYVSGYLRTEPPEGSPRLEGADATHAWVEVWCGEATGWIGLDPTNGIAAGDDHIVLAVGRDYADVSPLDGVIFAYGDHGVEVKVDVIPLEAERPVRPVAEDDDPTG